jgi:hypothetical protein
MAMTEEEAQTRLLVAVGDDGTVEDQWDALWLRYAHMDATDPTGELRYKRTLVDAAELMVGRAARAVDQNDPAGGSISASQWYTHQREILKTALEDYNVFVKALTLANAAVAWAPLAAYSLTPLLPGQVGLMPDPASPYYLGDPRYMGRGPR